MTAPQDQPLFRREAVEHSSERLYGEVHIAVPVAWQAIGFILVAGLCAALVFLAASSYSRVETVTGAIVLDRGVVPIVPGRAGTVSAVHVREGQNVPAGAPLVLVRVEEDLVGGGTTATRQLQALGEQDERLEAQHELVLRAAAAEQSRLTEQIAGFMGELASLNDQIAAQVQLVEAAEDALSDIQEVAGRGFISRRDLEAREASLLTRRQQLAQLRQAQAALAADLAQARQAMAHAAASAEAEASGIEADRAALAQRLAQAEAERGYSLTAHVAGRVTALAARPGQPVTADRPLLFVVPANARLHAELYIPVGTAGFIESGQEVQLAIDAFPHQRFGTIPARILHMSSVAVPRTAEAGVGPVYVATVQISGQSVFALGGGRPLLPGMTLTARVTTDRRSLLQWLFEPMLAIHGP